MLLDTLVAGPERGISARQSVRRPDSETHLLPMYVRSAAGRRTQPERVPVGWLVSRYVGATEKSGVTQPN